MTMVEELRKKIVCVLQEDNTLNLMIGTNIGSITLEIAELATEHFHTIHSKALACHCECLGMNAENSFAICLGKQIPYGDDSYLATLQKWGLIDEKGNPII